MDLEITKRPTSYNEGGVKSDCSIINIFDARAYLVTVNQVLMCLMNIQIWPVAAFVHWLLFVQIFVIPCVRFWYGYNCECEDPTRGECNIVQQWMVLATNSFYLAIDLHMILVNTILFIHLSRHQLARASPALHICRYFSLKESQAKNIENSG